MKKSLICIMTCNRLEEVKKYILPYVQFCNTDEHFEFLLALDGTQADYLDFCEAFKIPLLYSDEREGVGISKNRVFKKFPDFDCYFFLDDDVELFDQKVFERHVKISDERNVHHLSVTPPRKEIIPEVNPAPELVYSEFGGAYFNFYTKGALENVGGWHPAFAKYKRYGHTEHTYRAFNAGLTKYPFNIIKECIEMLILHDPPHVSQLSSKDEDADTQIHAEEQALIDQKLVYFPVTTLSDFHFNGYDLNFNPLVFEYLKNNKRKYPLLKGSARMKCFSEYYFFKFEIEKTKILKIYYYLKSFLCFPFSNQFKHSIKKMLQLV